jgi:hypothetical protein
LSDPPNAAAGRAIERRSTREIRLSIADTRARLDEDLDELEQRVHDQLSPRELVMRHPAIASVAGIIVGVLVVRNPALIGRGLSRLAQWSAPFLFKALLPKN